MAGTAPRPRPGEVNVARGRKTVYLTVGVWLASDGQIHLSFGKGGITKVSNNPKSKRYHKQLYRHIRNVLEQADRWNPVADARHLYDDSQLSMSL